MKDPKKTKRRILTAGAGVVAFTAFEGLACGNPVAPAYENRPHPDPTVDTTATPPATATATASGTTGVAPASTSNITVTSQR
jgi:hypothetical protein